MQSMHDWRFEGTMLKNERVAGRRSLGLWAWGLSFALALSVFGCADLDAASSTIRLSPFGGA